ncbi:hypothetical protein [Methanobrevibacter sp.]|uniref:hypothetical protein n=1 Tax=Methanobrevibacter sp. TaxID=66852 RepID=UPI003890CD7E
MIGNDSTAPNTVVNDDNLVLLTSDDSNANDNNTNPTYSLGGLSLPDLHNGLILTNNGNSVAKSLSDRPGVILDGNGDFSMSAKYNTSAGCRWFLSSDSYGVDLISINNVIDQPDAYGSFAITNFKFHVHSDDYYVKLILLSPTGKILKEIDSNMIN